MWISSLIANFHLVRNTLAALAGLAIVIALPSGALAQNPHAGIYFVTFSGSQDSGQAGILVRNSGSAIVAGFDAFDVLGFVKQNVAVSANGAFSDSNIDGLGTSVSGNFSSGTVSGSFMADNGAVGSFNGSEEPATGFLRRAAGYYRGSMSGEVTVNGVKQFSTSGEIVAILAADGSAFGLGSAKGGGFSADDGGFITVTSGGGVSGVFLDGTQINGTVNTANRTASGSYSITVFVDGVLAVHSGTWEMARTVAMPNAAPLAVDDNYSATAKQALVVDAASGLLANDSDPDGDPLTAKLGTGPSHGSLTLNANGGFSYTADGEFAGVDTFTYRANDGLANSGLATVSIEVEPPAATAGLLLLLLE